MNFDFLKDIGQQVASIWKKINFYQQLSIAAVIVILLGIFAFIIIDQNYTSYSPLFPNDKQQVVNSDEAIHYLEAMDIPYKIGQNGAIFVSDDQIGQLRSHLANLGLTKVSNSKGYELFDNNTWIKGEKELQILEIRALKGQLEQDLIQYRNIRGANVILDIAPPRPFGGNINNTKASVILNLVPGTRLSASELQAISYHVSGAVRGLTPNKVAISDTSGKLYQPLDSDETSEFTKGIEERIRNKIENVLSVIVGQGNFYDNVQVSAVPEPNKDVQDVTKSILKTSASSQIPDELAREKSTKITNIAVSVLVDKSLVWENLSKEQQLHSELMHQLQSIVDGYNAKSDITIDFVTFDKNSSSLVTPVEVHTGYDYFLPLILTTIGSGLLLILGIILWYNRPVSTITSRQGSSKKSEKEKKLNDSDLEEMIRSLQDQALDNPRPIVEFIRHIIKEKNNDKLS